MQNNTKIRVGTVVVTGKMEIDIVSNKKFSLFRYSLFPFGFLNTIKKERSLIQTTWGHMELISMGTY